MRVLAVALAIATIGAVGADAALAADPTLVAAGDIACAPGRPSDASQCQMQATATAVQGLNPTAVATLGDNQYENGTLSEFNAVFNPTWGAFKSLIHPAPGNHEYQTAGAAGYFSYFGAAAGDPSNGYYSYNLGAWHVVVLNSNCEFVSCAAGQAQDAWLRQDLASHHNVCTLAYWHHPLFTSGPNAGQADNLAVRPLWQDLYDAGADLVLNGHDHSYERFAPQTPAGVADPGRGVREIVVGTGGEDLYTIGGPLEANSEAHYDPPTFGVLSLAMHPRSYTWSYHPVGGTYTDAGTTACYDRPPQAALSSSPTTPAAGSPVSFDGSGSSDPDGSVVGYHWDFGDGTTAGTAAPTHAYLAPGSYTVRLTVTDDGGNSASTSRVLTVAPATTPPVPPGGTTPPVPPAGTTPPVPPAGTTPSSVTGGGNSTSTSGALTVAPAGTTPSNEPQPPAPIAAFTFFPRGPSAGRVTIFHASGSTAGASYVWSFGDGRHGAGRIARHNYAHPGNFTATLTVTDSAGGVASAQRTVAVAPRPPRTSMRGVRGLLGDVRRRGLVVRIRADVSAKARLLVEIGRERARSLGFEEADNQIVIGGRTVRLRARHTTAAAVPLTREARRLLGHVRKTVLVVIARVRTPEGGQKVVRRTVDLRR